MVMPQLDISDHCKVIIKLDNIVNVKNKADKINDDYVWVQKPESFKWHPDALEIFKETLSNNKDIDELISDAEQRLEAGLIETTGKRIQDIFIKTAELCFSRKGSKIKQTIKIRLKIRKKIKSGLIRNVEN